MCRRVEAVAGCSAARLGAEKERKDRESWRNETKKRKRMGRTGRRLYGWMHGLVVCLERAEGETL